MRRAGEGWPTVTASRSELIAAARRLRERAAAEGVRRSAAARAAAIVDSVAARAGDRSLLLRAAQRVRESGSEGRLAEQVARFLELLAGREGPVPAGLPLPELLYVAHWARRLLPEEPRTVPARTGPGAAARSGGPSAPRTPPRPGRPVREPLRPAGPATARTVDVAAGAPAGARSQPAGPSPTALELAMREAMRRQEQERERRPGR